MTTTRRSVPLPPEDLDPLVEVVAAGSVLWRCHDRRFASAQSNPGLGAPGRFHPFDGPGQVPVPVLYVSASAEGALAETVLHDVPVAGRGRRVSWARLGRMGLSRLAAGRDLHLVVFHGAGLRRLGLRPAQLTDTSPAHYARTVAWAAAAHRWNGEVDGIIWMSRQLNSERALVLFGDRVEPGALVPDGGPAALDDAALPGVVDLLVRAGVLLGLE
ncbi:MAG: RES family NAD+ phosphorylase [Acidimicrobiales bacterium]